MKIMLPKIPRQVGRPPPQVVAITFRLYPIDRYEYKVQLKATRRNASNSVTMNRGHHAKTPLVVATRSPLDILLGSMDLRPAVKVLLQSSTDILA